jgi:hypothetical protein
MDYTAIGRTVNLASRIEQSAPNGGILISNETYSYVDDTIRCEEAEKISVKGIAHPITTYKVIEAIDSQSDSSAEPNLNPHQISTNIDPSKMTDEERQQTREALEDALRKFE